MNQDSPQLNCHPDIISLGSDNLLCSASFLACYCSTTALLNLSSILRLRLLSDLHQVINLIHNGKPSSFDLKQENDVKLACLKIDFRKLKSIRISQNFLCFKFCLI
jgi:hypothetical protein